MFGLLLALTDFQTFIRPCKSESISSVLSHFEFSRLAYQSWHEIKHVSCIHDVFANCTLPKNKASHIHKYVTLLFYNYEYQKRAPSNFAFLGLLGIHSNPNWKEFLKCCESFLRKSSVCTLTDLNPGFGGPWDILWIFLGYGPFIMLQKKSFGRNIFWISCSGSEVPFWQFFNTTKMALLNPCMKC